MIQIINVTKSFNNKTVLNNLSLNINKGQIYGLLGANGAGKSTTINLLLGFLKPDTGTIKIENSNLYDNLYDIRKYVGYIPEDVNIYDYLTGVENLDYFSKLSGLNYKKKELEQFLKICGLREDSFNVKSSHYSKGMRQKVAIAIAYAKKAKIYLLDEPASGLDPLSSNELTELMKNLVKRGATILMASHDIFRVRESCDRIGILKNGALLKDIESHSVTSNELEKIYLNFMKS